MTTQTTQPQQEKESPPPAQINSSGLRTLITVPAMAGIVYSAAWIVGLVAWLSNLDVTASGSAVLAGYAGYQTNAMVQYALTEGVAAVALVVVMLAVGRAVHARNAAGFGRVAMLAGIGAAVISLIQCGLGQWLAGWVVPHHDANLAGTIFTVINRMDGVKMLILAAMAVAGAGLSLRARVLPRWLGFVGVLLAVALVASGIGYLLLLSPLAQAAFASLPLLLVWVTGTGVALASARK
jgi:hypothetical protein